MPRRIDSAVKIRSMWMVAEYRGESPSLTGCCEQVVRRLRMGKKTFWGWTLQVESASVPSLASTVRRAPRSGASSMRTGG